MQVIFINSYIASCYVSTTTFHALFHHNTAVQVLNFVYNVMHVKMTDSHVLSYQFKMS